MSKHIDYEKFRRRIILTIAPDHPFTEQLGFVVQGRTSTSARKLARVIDTRPPLIFNVRTAAFRKLVVDNLLITASHR